MKRSAFNPDNNGGGICRTIKAVQAKLGYSDFFRNGSFGATGVIEFYEVNTITDTFGGGS